MPKLTPEMQKARAKRLIKGLAEVGFNKTALARKEGVSTMAIIKRCNRDFVKKTFDECLLEVGVTDEKAAKVLLEGLEANKVIGYLNNKINGTQKVSDEFIEVPDKHCRHKYLVTYLEFKRYLKHNNSANGIKIINIINGYRNNGDAGSLRPEEQPAKST